MLNKNSVMSHLHCTPDMSIGAQIPPSTIPSASRGSQCLFYVDSLVVFWALHETQFWPCRSSLPAPSFYAATLNHCPQSPLIFLRLSSSSLRSQSPLCVLFPELYPANHGGQEREHNWLDPLRGSPCVGAWSRLLCFALQPVLQGIRTPTSACIFGSGFTSPN